MDRARRWPSWWGRSRHGPVALLLLALGALGMTGPTPGVAAPDGCQFWVAPPPAGDDAGPGTAARPWATLSHAAAQVPNRGCTVTFAPGTYRGANALKRRFRHATTFRAAVAYQAVLEHSGTVLDIDGGRNIALEGFELRHDGPGATGFLAIVDRRDDVWSEGITFRNNVFHDSYGDDLLKIHNGVRFATVAGNVFYNQGDGEQHLDVNSVTDVVIEDNVFFNDFPGSGRVDSATTKHFVVVKDSNGADDGLTGSERVIVRRNVLLNWQGGLEAPIKVGNDGMPYHEASGVVVENNLIVGNSPNLVDAAFAVRGAADVTFVNNTVVGDLPAKLFAYRLHRKGANPRNEDIRFVNNIWADPTGTMGAEIPQRPGHLSKSDPAETVGLVHDHNLYWNGGGPIPRGREISPLADDLHRVVKDPLLPTDQSEVVLPRWTGDGFASGNATIRGEFLRLVRDYGAIPPDSPAVDSAHPGLASRDDILGRRRVAPDIGAYEVHDVPAPGTAAAATGALPAVVSGSVLLLALLPLLALRRAVRARPPQVVVVRPVSVRRRRP